MLILHTADLHLGVERYGRIDPQTGLSSRLGDFLAVLDQAVECALAQKVDLFLFCGDAYKSHDPTQTQQRELARRVNRLAAAGIPVFLLAGNHDLPRAPARASAVEIFDTLAVERVTVAHTPKSYLLQTASGPLQLVALPWAHRSALMTREESRGMGLEEVNRAIEERLSRWLEAQAQALDPSLPALLAAHGWVSGAKAGSEKGMVLGQDHVLLRSTLAQPGYDYIAMGHLHRRQTLGSSPPIVYSGSLERLDFGEEGEDKGFYLVDIDPTRKSGERLVSYTFHPVKARSFLTIEVQPRGEDPTPAVLEAIAHYPLEGVVVRLQLKLRSPQDAQLREADVRHALQGAYSFAINLEVEREQRTRLGSQARGITPQEALRAYLETRKPPLDPSWAQELLRYGESLIASSTGSERRGAPAEEEP